VYVIALVTLDRLMALQGYVLQEQVLPVPLPMYCKHNRDEAGVAEGAKLVPYMIPGCVACVAFVLAVTAPQGPQGDSVAPGAPGWLVDWFRVVCSCVECRGVAASILVLSSLTLVGGGSSCLAATGSLQAGVESAGWLWSALLCSEGVAPAATYLLRPTADMCTSLLGAQQRAMQW
jgi:hypothetical protein